jgi:hypothetical protein
MVFFYCRKEYYTDHLDYMLVGLGGLVAIVFAIGPKVRGF